MFDGYSNHAGGHRKTEGVMTHIKLREGLAAYVPLLFLALVSICPALFAGDGSIDPATGAMKFSVNFRYPPTPAQLADAKAALTMMSQMICDATDGQVRVSEIRLTGGAAEEDRAAFWFLPESFRSGGGFMPDGSYLETLGAHLNLAKNAQFRGDILAHEMGHHGFGLGEQYDEQRRFGGGCGIGRGFELAAIDEQNHTLMQQTGFPQCVGGTNAGNLCLRDANCPTGSCQPVLMSEFSVPINHDLVRGDNVLCPAPAPLTQTRLWGRLVESDPTQVFDPTDFDTAEASSSFHRNVEAIDDTGSLPAAEITFFATHTAARQWTLSAAIDSGFVGGTAGDLTLLEQWTLDFNPDGSLRSVSEDPPDLSVTGLTSGGSDLAVSLNFGTPDPTDTPGQGEDGLRSLATGTTWIWRENDGLPLCTATNCAIRWNSITNRYETTHQSLIHNFDSDWETLVENYNLTLPAGLPVANPLPACLAAPAFVEDVVGIDQVLLIMDRSYSMILSSREGTDEACDNGRDDDWDGIIDEAQCAESRINFVKGAARAFVDLQRDAGIEVGLLQFNETNSLVRSIAALDATNVEDVKSDIESLTPDGWTAIGDALQASLAEFTRVRAAGRSQTAFLMTDGFNNRGSDPQTQVQALKDDGIRVFTIPAGSAADAGGLAEIAEQTGGKTIAPESLDELPAVYAELAAQYGGSGLILPRTFFSIAPRVGLLEGRAPGTLATPRKDIPAERVFTLPVEAGAEALVAFVSGRNARMATWRLRLELRGPGGEFYTPASPEFTADPYYLFFRVPNPSPGDWTLRAVAGGVDLQESIALAFVENPEPRFFADVRPRRPSASQAVHISANPIYVVDLEGGTTIEGIVSRPDGSLKAVELTQDPLGRAWGADFSDYVGRGTYEVSLRLNVTEEAVPFRGEPIFEGPERYPVKVEPFQRTTSLTFYVKDGPFPTCGILDCDRDGIPNNKECSEDTDRDGVPDRWDTDSDNDELPDSLEGLHDRDQNGVPDACEPSEHVPPPAPVSPFLAHEVGFFLGGLFPDGALPLNSGLNTGFRYGYHFRRRFSAELETGLVFTDLLGSDGLLGHVQAHLRAHLGSSTQPVRPFLLVGVGGATFKTTGLSESSPVVVYGVGADFNWHRKVGFRLDARDFVLTDLFNRGATHNFQLLWGVVFRF